jgi:WD40 repeat protein
MGGHRNPIYGTAFSPDGKYLATASEDSTVRIWLVQSHKLVATLSEGMDPNYECLRVAWMKKSDIGYLLASGGADGVVRLWSAVETIERQLECQCVGSLNHFVEDDEERPQIYALQFIQSPSFPNVEILLTSAHDSVYLWTIENDEESVADSPPPNQSRKFLSLLSIQFSHLDDESQTYQFGGSRNPENELYVFDASYSESNDLIAAALSDGTCRVLSLAASSNVDEDENLQREQVVLSLPPGYFAGRGGHLTAVEWDSSGNRLATCVASGRVILWYLHNVGVGDSTSLRPSVVSILDGGSGRQVFGAKYCCGGNEDLLLTWGIEGTVSVWDSFSVGEVMSPICTLVSHADYPIFALDITETGTKKSIAVGGGKEGGFLGVPAYIYDV